LESWRLKKRVAEGPNNTITEVTRRAIVDYLSVGRRWSGSLNEDEFLGRIYDLKRMPSTDYRHEFDNAAKDIHKHRVMNSDWSDDWVFTDERFDLLHGPDEPFLKFLAETVHPIVRPGTAESEKMVAEYNALLAADGWEIHPVKEISGRPVYGYRRGIDSARPHLQEAARVAEALSGHYVAQQVRRMQEAVEKDPELAIGTAKEFLETLCKTILSERRIAVSKNEDFPALVKATVKSLSVVPKSLAAQPQSEKTIAALLGNLGAIGHQLAEMRNQSGTGHGKFTEHVGLEKKHAKLAVGAAATLAVFLYECHEAEKPA
jgi:AbiJ N-terminal domain 3/Abortive infection C-terminus